MNKTNELRAILTAAILCLHVGYFAGYCPPSGRERSTMEEEKNPQEVPKTGDTANAGRYLFLLTGAGIGLGVLELMRRKRKK